MIIGQPVTFLFLICNKFVYISMLSYFMYSHYCKPTYILLLLYKQLSCHERWRKNWNKCQHQKTDPCLSWQELHCPCMDMNKWWTYLYKGHPKHRYIEDTVSDESSQVQSQEVKVETYNTENKTKCNCFVSFFMIRWGIMFLPKLYSLYSAN